MKIQDVMTKKAEFCWPETSLAVATALMWERDCGALPVVIDGGIVVGMITDRDIAMAVGMKNCPPAALQAREVMSQTVYACRPTDDIHTALKLMRKNKVRRLPVTDEHGILQGILSINDVMLAAEHADGKRAPALNYTDVINTFKALCEHRHIEHEAKPLAMKTNA